MNEGRAVDKAWDEYWADRGWVSPFQCIEKINEREWLRYAADYILPGDDTGMMTLLHFIKRAALAEETGDKAAYVLACETIGKMVVECTGSNAVEVFEDEVNG